ncbi:MAG: hypothetical protein ACO1O3_04260, partial [Sphingobium sp.]
MLELVMLLAAAPLDAAQQRDIGCVATLAVVAYEQQRGETRWPPVGEDGARLAQIVGERVMKQSGRTREQVRDAIVAAVAERQKAKALPDEDVEACLALMRKEAPPPPPPGLPQCAAMLKLAYDEEHGRNGLSEDAKRLATIASILDHKAREALRGEGRSGPE